MSYRLLFPDSYLRRAKKFFKRHPEVLGQYQKTLQLLEVNPYHPSLRLHGLKGRLQGLSSVSINMQYRIILEFEIHGEDIVLVDIGDHDGVY
ncbi:MAG: plasmid stabilization protein [Spongiibacter sp.]|uniref:type II toxin-antitoxin system RelE/ParE family toxin n=1 Tax=Spongiibacter sp. TaxID=2024860 RepID=UPI000C0A2CCC|nr:type II toxin-antitoxin system RelE/ParE family toxin [Spongiibacter sp.]MAK42563.1 plasmid stabilization protein [Spongiibacter sp.]